MIEVLPIKVLRDEDGPIFGPINVLLAKLAVQGLPVAKGFVVTPPNLKLKTTLEHYNFDSYEVIEQSLALVKKDLEKIPVPDILKKELGGNDNFLLGTEIIKGIGQLWKGLLFNWVEDLKSMIWQSGFAPGVTEKLQPQSVILVDELKAFGRTTLDSENEVVVQILKGDLEPKYLKQLDELVTLANKKLLIPYEFLWVLDKGIKLAGIFPYTPRDEVVKSSFVQTEEKITPKEENSKSAIKLFLDLSAGEIPVADFDGVYLSGEKIYDLNKPAESFDKLVLKIIEGGNLEKSVLLKLADKSEGMGKVRGALRLLHQKSLLDSFAEAINFTRQNKALFNIHLVVPFVRGSSEFLAVKRDLALKKITRGNAIQIWMELAIPENIINLEDYVTAGLDGLVLNLDEMVSHLSGFDINEQELLFYKRDLKALFNFLEDGLKVAHKLKVPFIAVGSVILYPEVLEYLVERGVYGVVVERYEVDAGRDLVQKMERKLVNSRSKNS